MVATPGLDFKIVLIDNGCVVVRAPQSKVALFDRRPEMEAATFAFLHAHVHELPLAKWDEFRDWAQV